MIDRIAFLSLTTAVLLQSNLTLGQTGSAARPEGPRDRNSSPLVAQFLATAPELGEPPPDVTIFDDQGHPVNLRELTRRGHYTVLTFGCLT